MDREKRYDRLEIAYNMLVRGQGEKFDSAVEAIKTLVKVDEDWIPSAEGTSLYIRPFIREQKKLL